MKYPEKDKKFTPEPSEVVISLGPTTKEWQSLTPEEKQKVVDALFPGAADQEGRRDDR